MITNDCASIIEKQYKGGSIP